jgi:hypothetical protein
MYFLSNLIRKELNFLFLLSTLLFVSIDILSYNYIVLGQEDRREKDDDDDRREKDDDDDDDDDRREKDDDDDDDDDRREKDDDVPFILPLPFP